MLTVVFYLRGTEEEKNPTISVRNECELSAVGSGVRVCCCVYARSRDAVLLVEK